MLLRAFAKKSTPLQLIPFLLTGTVMLLWIWRNETVVHVPEASSSYYRVIAEWMQTLSQVWVLTFTTSIFVMLGVLLFRLAHGTGVLQRSHQRLTVLFVWLCLIALPSNFSIHPAAMAMLLFIPAIMEVIRAGKEKRPIQAIFNSGALLSMASLIDLPMLLFIPSFFIALLVFRLYKWNYLAVLASGMMLPWVYALTIGWITGFWPFSDMHSLAGIYVSGALFFPALVSAGFLVWDYVLVGVLVLFMAVAFLSVYSRLGQRLIHVRYTFRVLLWLALPVLPLLSIAGVMVLHYLMVFGFFLTIVGTNYLATAKRSVRNELWLWLVTVLVVIGYVTRW